MRRYLLLFLLLLSLAGFAQSYTPPPPPDYHDPGSALDTLKSGGADEVLSKNLVTDNVVYPKKFRPNFRENYRGAEFDYTTVKPRESIWEKLERRLIKLWQTVFGDIDARTAPQYAEIFLRIFAIIIVAVVLYFLINFLLGKEGNYFFSRKNRKIAISGKDLHENIHEINFPQTIDEFERKKDFRSAVRYRFLFVLKQLSDSKIIDWNPEKTNRDYFFEIKNNAAQNRFSELVYIFDYVWYGEFELDEKSYQHYRGKFLNFKTEKP